MRIWFDTEFYENGRSISLISIGMVREDGATYYAESPAALRLCARSEWLTTNVQPHLRGPDVERGLARMSDDIVKFAGEAPEFWAYYASYDWVVLCQLFGRMIDLPKHWPMRVRDVMQLADNVPDARVARALKPAQQNEHDALADALWTQKYWLALRDK